MMFFSQHFISSTTKRNRLSGECERGPSYLLHVIYGSSLVTGDSTHNMPAFNYALTAGLPTWNVFVSSPMIGNLIVSVKC